MGRPCPCVLYSHSNPSTCPATWPKLRSLGCWAASGMKKSATCASARCVRFRSVAAWSGETSLTPRSISLLRPCPPLPSSLLLFSFTGAAVPCAGRGADAARPDGRDGPRQPAGRRGAHPTGRAVRSWLVPQVRPRRVPAREDADGWTLACPLRDLTLVCPCLPFCNSHPTFKPEPSLTDIINQGSLQSTFASDNGCPFVGLINGMWTWHSGATRLAVLLGVGVDHLLFLCPFLGALSRIDSVVVSSLTPPPPPPSPRCQPQRSPVRCGKRDWIQQGHLRSALLLGGRQPARAPERRPCVAGPGNTRWREAAARTVHFLPVSTNAPCPRL